uniref:Uncharacterized protein n=1 Tax=Triticum urartu TaxID=4572 RepID=A0A8R7PTZ1_TRIUA
MNASTALRNSSSSSSAPHSSGAADEVDRRLWPFSESDRRISGDPALLLPPCFPAPIFSDLLRRGARTVTCTACLSSNTASVSGARAGASVVDGDRSGVAVKERNWSWASWSEAEEEDDGSRREKT